ncbi:MAG TPA: hypothetical protein VHG32_27320 [Thermoanaerobaculia bacterium]|nr:hypothetical protein [Thermoanaerobaculia bacterium]
MTPARPAPGELGQRTLRRRAPTLPAGRSPVQWALPAAAAAAYLVAALVWVGNDRRAARAVFPTGSVWNTGDNGLSLAFAYLSARASGQPAGISVLTRRLESTPLPPRAVLLRVEPDTTSLEAMMRRLQAGEEEDDDAAESGGGKHDAKAETGKPGAKADAGKRAPAVPRLPLWSAAEEDWVRGGGRLVLAVAGGTGDLVVGRPARLGAARKAFPIWPGVRQLLPDPARTLGGPALAGMHALWLAGDAPIVARLALGAGDVILLACPEVLHNRLLGRGDHLALLEALAGRAGDAGSDAGAGSTGSAGGGGSRPVFFDERTHGAEQSAGVVEILASWGLGPLLLLLVAAAGAAWWRAAVRVGPPDRDDRDARSEAVELLDSLADLYGRALGRGDAIRLYHESFVRTVAADTGLHGEALAARAAALAPGLSLAELPPPAAPDLSRPAFDRMLDTINQAFRRLDDAKRR